MSSTRSYGKDNLKIPYSILHGYVVPDSEEGFDGFDTIDPIDLVQCPFVRIPYDKDLAESHCLEDVIKKDKEKKRKQNNCCGVGRTTDGGQEEGPAVKKVKEEEMGNQIGESEVKGVFEEDEYEGIHLTNVMMRILCPSYKTMPQYREIPYTYKENMQDLRRMEELEKMEDNIEFKNKLKLKKLEEMKNKK